MRARLPTFMNAPVSLKFNKNESYPRDYYINLDWVLIESRMTNSINDIAALSNSNLQFL